MITAWLLLQIATGTAASSPLQGQAPADPQAYEAITGESPEDEHGVWDSFYKKRNHAFGQEPVSFLKRHFSEIKKGRAFVPAMGEGRNAIFLARHGFDVDGVDLSSIAVDRAVEDARAQKTRIKGVVADLNQYAYPKEAYDLVLVSLFHSESLLPKFKKSLKKNGILMLYLKRDTGKPAAKMSPDDFLVKSDALRVALQEMQILKFEEYEDQGDPVIGVLARKR